MMKTGEPCAPEADDQSGRRRRARLEIGTYSKTKQNKKLLRQLVNQGDADARDAESVRILRWLTFYEGDLRG